MTTRRILHRLAFSAVAGAVAGLALGVVLAGGMPREAGWESAAHAWNARTGNFQALSIGPSDQFYNYDNLSTALPPSGNNVDFAVTMVFGSNATVNKVKTALGSSYPHAGGPMYLRLKDSPNFVWDQDSGRKDILCPGPGAWSSHLRIYADADDFMYNPYWGNYVLATTHKDQDECSTDREFGWGELIEEDFTNYFSSHGYYVNDDWASFYNNEPYRVEAPGTSEEHFWQNNTYATWVGIP